MFEIGKYYNFSALPFVAAAVSSGKLLSHALWNISLYLYLTVCYFLVCCIEFFPSKYCRASRLTLHISSLLCQNSVFSEPMFFCSKIFLCFKVKVTQSYLTLCDPGQTTGVGSLSLLQEIFPTQG